MYLYVYAADHTRVGLRLENSHPCPCHAPPHHHHINSQLLGRPLPLSSHLTLPATHLVLISPLLPQAMDPDFPFGYEHRQKRTHAQMEGHEDSLSPTWANFNREPSAGASQPQPLSQPNPHQHVSGLHLPRPANMPPTPPRRHPGDGFDFRRPINYSNFVDLTADDETPSYAPPPSSNSTSRHANNGGSRLPRGMDIIIDLDAEDEQRQPTGLGPPSSPEVQFVASRRIDPPSREPSAFGRTNSEGDDVEFLRENALPEAEVRRRRERELDLMADFFESMDGRFTHLRAQLERTVAHVHRTAAQMRHGRPVPPARARGPIVNFVAPSLDFQIVGFDLGLGGDRTPEPPHPTYDAPEKAPEGFTRSPEEEDVLVCPNCANELCVGEDERKRQVWIVKHCGHVYCGECTANRSIKRSAKGKEKQTSGKTKPFKECVVEGCGKKVSNPKAMIQVFL